MTPTDSDRVCLIESTHDQGKPACLVTWGTVRSIAAPAAVLGTARDLMAAAAGAETDVALIAGLREDLKLQDGGVGAVLEAVRARRTPPPTPSFLRVHTVAAARTNRPLVHIGRGSMKGALTPDEARAMAQQWTEAAVSAQMDVRIRYALGEWGALDPDDVDRFFTILQGLQR
ncbi:hypothetical protein K5X85_29110 [Streptomyces sp. A144]|uniref:hypothetical protein n=1 Tax=Streptomyces sp. A144 TaxID=2871487 RepID=UPI001CBD6312|nr:hypothetical protein [Streptomyces sp. A144]UAX56789.1 hypothetical protein K5X85_29110 [Streptomyces sp. A144]